MHGLDGLPRAPWHAPLSDAGLGLLQGGHLSSPDWSPEFGPRVCLMFVFTLCLLGYWKLGYRAKLHSLGLRFDRLLPDLKFALLAAIGMGLFYLAAAGGYWVVLQLFTENGDALFKEHLRGAIYKDPSLLYYLGVMFFFPVYEEIWFRGLLYTPLRREWGPWPVIILLSLLFAFSHSNAVPINQFFGGLIFAWAFERTRSLVAPILLHIAGNSALAVVGWALVKWELV